MASQYDRPEDWADTYRVNLQTVYKWIRQGRINAVNVGTDRRPVYRIPKTEQARYDKRNSAA